MTIKKSYFIYFLVNFLTVQVRCVTNVFDYELYESVLDPVACEEQLLFLANDTFGLQFIDSSAKFPSGILSGNLVDLGRYHQCLAIQGTREQLDIRGKYCTVNIPLEQNIAGVNMLAHNNGGGERVVAASRRMVGIQDLGIGDLRVNGITQTSIGLKLGVCIPRVCTVNQTLSYLLEMFPMVDLKYNEGPCRLPGDKPTAAADYVFWTLFAIIVLITIASTAYDLFNKIYLNKVGDAKYRSFSVYTNTRRFLTFPSTPGSLPCLDGIRAVSMMWVVVGHSFAFTLARDVANMKDVMSWLQSVSSVWIVSGPISVDTFLTLSGVLCAYTTVGKTHRGKFIRNIYVFYLHRLLRMFPLLAVVVLFQASWAHHLSDGPNWAYMGSMVRGCRQYWWSALLHAQNYYNPTKICLGQSWYMSVDIQLYLLSPLVLVWLFGRRAIAWTALSATLLLSVASAAIYCYINNFHGSFININDFGHIQRYMTKYYYNTLTRAPPFVVGLIIGYILNITKGKKIYIPKIYSTILWASSLVLMSSAIIPVYFFTQPGYSAQGLDNFFNAFVRAIWAVGLGWLIFACVHGYGGPINWFLSLSMWKLPARLSYAVYLLHLPVIAIANAALTETTYFTPAETVYRFASDLTMSTFFAFILCVTVDAPFSTWQKILLTPPRKTRIAPVEDHENGKVANPWIKNEDLNNDNNGRNI